MGANDLCTAGQIGDGMTFSQRLAQAARSRSAPGPILDAAAAGGAPPRLVAPCAMRRSAARPSGFGLPGWNAPGCSRGGGGRPAGRRGARMRALLLAGPRRPPRHGRRRPASRPADRAQGLRRVDRHSGRRRPADPAFELLADPQRMPTPPCGPSWRGLARAAGAGGMVGGQCLDLEADKLGVTRAAVGHVQRLQAMKTGALIRFACEAGAILGARRRRSSAGRSSSTASGWARLPDRRRPARPRRRCGRHGQGGRQGRRQGDPGVVLGPQAAKARLAALEAEARPPSTRSVPRADILREAAASWCNAAECRGAATWLAAPSVYTEHRALLSAPCPGWPFPGAVRRSPGTPSSQPSDDVCRRASFPGRRCRFSCRRQKPGREPPASPADRGRAAGSDPSARPRSPGPISAKASPEDGQDHLALATPSGLSSLTPSNSSPRRFERPGGRCAPCNPGATQAPDGGSRRLGAATARADAEQVKPSARQVGPTSRPPRPRIAGEGWAGQDRRRARDGDTGSPPRTRAASANSA